MSEAADPEDVDALLRELLRRARARSIESHGGTVEKFIGDAVVGVFGVPAVHEDDPERAVRAGLRILEALEGMTRPDGTPARGARRRQHRRGARAPRRRPRLRRAASSPATPSTPPPACRPPRRRAGVVVGALTHELTERVIVYEELPPVAAKGKAEPVAAWLAPAARRAHRPPHLRRARTTPFVGRERRARRASSTHCRRPSRQRDGAGSCLARRRAGHRQEPPRAGVRCASLDARPEMVTWRQGRCLPYGEGVTFWALGEILKAHAGILDSDDVATVEAKLEAVLPDGDDGHWLRQRLRPLLGSRRSQAVARGELRRLDALPRAIAGPRPAVVVLEDLHWAGEAMLAFVEHLLARGLEAPLLLLATTRPELLRRHEGALTPPRTATGSAALTLRGLCGTAGRRTRRRPRSTRRRARPPGPNPRARRRQPALRRAVRAPPLDRGCCSHGRRRA